MLEGDLLGDEANGITHDITDGGGNQGAEEDGFDRVAGGDACQEGDGESQGSEDPGDEGGEFTSFSATKRVRSATRGAGARILRISAGRGRTLPPPGSQAREEAGFGGRSAGGGDVDVVIHAIGPGLDALGGGGIGILLDEGRPFADGLLDGGVGDDIAGERDVGFQELPGDGGDALVDLEGFIAAAGHIDHDADAGGAISRNTGAVDGTAADEDFTEQHKRRRWRWARAS